MLNQRYRLTSRRWFNIVQMLYKCFVFGRSFDSHIDLAKTKPIIMEICSVKHVQFKYCKCSEQGYFS